MAECEHLARTSAYFDGALARSDEAVAVEHLATCAECQTLLGDAVGLDVAVSHAAAKRSEGARPIATDELARARTHRRGALAVVAVLAAAAVLTWFVWPRRHAPARVALVLPHDRALEARFAGGPFAAYRPLGALRGVDRAHEPLPLSALAELERAGDQHALIAALAATGDLVRAGDLAEAETEDLASDLDRAAIALARGDFDRALAQAERAALRDPSSPVAAWNVGLAARALGLRRVARRAFARVIDAHEPGWVDEATAIVRALDNELAIETGFAAFDARAAAMVAGGGLISTDDIAHYPARARIAFLDAARLAPDRARLAELAPLATALDRASGTTTATAVVNRVDPALAGKFATRYRSVLAGTASSAEVVQLIGELRAAGAHADDLRFGAIVLARLTGERAAELAAISAPWHDPWFTLLVARERIRHDFPGNDLRATGPLTELASGCTNSAWSLRCGAIRQDLAQLELATGEPERAQAHARAAVELDEQAGSLPITLSARAVLAEVHRLRGLTARARGEFEELELAATDHCDLVRYAKIGQAELDLVSGELALAHASLPSPEPPPGCTPEPDIIGITVAVDLSRAGGTATDRTVAERWLATAKGSADGGIELTGAMRLGTAGSEASLVAWIDQHRTATDPVIAGVRTWAVTTLLDTYASRAAWREMFELAHAPDAPCRVVASADDTTLSVAIATPAGLDGEHRSLLPGAPAHRISDRLIRALAACPEIALTARPPLHGRSNLLPAELPWWFAGDAGPHPRGPTPRALEVSGAQPPDATLVHAGTAPSVLPFDARLAGAAATPSATLAALASATYAELHVHGLASARDEDAAYLALSPERDGAFTLRADRVRGAKLAAGPLVVLAACRAALVAPYLAQRWSLPDAFVTAGASGVVAADVAIPEADARAVFDELHRRVDAGESAARALAELRAAAPADSWVRHLMLFR